MFKKSIIALIRIYQLLSKHFLRKACRFYPTCSQYTIEAIEKYGLWQGLWKGAKRVSKCHPWHPGGIDQP